LRVPHRPPAGPDWPEFTGRPSVVPAQAHARFCNGPLVVNPFFVTMLASLLNWGFSLIFGGLLVRALAQRSDLKMDYRAAGAAAYLGLGATWALGLSSSAAQLQSNPASMPKPLLQITGVIPFTETIFLWQSMALCGVLIVISTAVAWLSAPAPAHAKTAEKLGIDVQFVEKALPPRQRPSEWLEYSPLITILIVA
jgi:short-chain fatty acids transporter